jgi:thioredoxin reductase
MLQPVVIGSHLNAYAVAAKLKAKGAQECVVLDSGRRPNCPLYGLIYFRLRGSHPRFIGGVKTARLTGQGAVSRVELDSGISLPCDGIVVSSDLIPNSELAWLGGLNVEMPARRPVVDSNYQLSATGWFAAGNILGGFHDAEWCYHGGLDAAARVVKFIKP